LSSPSLMKYHTQLLTLAGEGTGKWTLSRLGTVEERLSVDREIHLLEKKVRNTRLPFSPHHC
jgi:ATP-binding cassette, subfamily D (ALD), peroxisomal long-chain fatty acid import protein